MKKTRLNLDELAVDSFATAPAGETPAGTVYAAEATYLSRCGTCWGVTCAPVCG